MTKLDAVLEKFRALPEDRQDAVAREFMSIIEDEASDGAVLTDEQWADLQARRADPGTLIPHEQVVAEFEKKFGR